MPKKKQPEEDLPDTFEDAMGELEDIVGELESSRMPLSDLVENYERGTRLLKYCQGQIKDARQKVEAITVANLEEGEVELEEFAPGEADPEPAPTKKKGTKPPQTDDDVRLF